ncbi:MAG: cation-translocating P-type ATPase [Candidatus Gastranaerophilales bacterium]|nr:cation-translocating P-type ATPase [Candidatus Gastranaerophilales bacterium]
MFEKCSVEETVDRLHTDREAGLKVQEAARRLAVNGKNELKEKKKKGTAERFLEQLNDPLIYVLIVAAVVSALLQEVSDAVIIGVVVLVNALVGMIQEGKAQKALDALKRLTSPQTTVIRGGVRKEIPAAQLVVGDLVCLEAGCQVPADLRLTKTVNLKAEESALTGETLPVEKDACFLADCAREIPLGDRRNMVYMSTIITCGRGEGIVTSTGMDTEIGRIAAMITETREELTPLQKRLGELGKVLSLLSLGLCAALFVIAVLQKRNVFEMLITALSLAVAAVPEGLPAVVTICLALSVTKMVRVNTIVRRLPSVETLGAVSVVCSDKTGTLTQNRMTVEKCWWDGRSETVESLAGSGGYAQKRCFAEHPDLVRGMVLCNDASLAGGGRLGDPTELALLDLAAGWGIQKEELETTMPRCGELPFDSDRKMMTTCHISTQSGACKKGVSYTKGAPDEVLKKCCFVRIRDKVLPMNESFRRQILQAVKEMSGEALRTLAVAMRDQVSGPMEERLVFLGMVGMRDPARPEATEAVETFREAGVSTVMITGDHVETAFAIGRQLGIVDRMKQCMTGSELGQLSDDALRERLADIRVFARVSPAQKVRIVKGFQQRGHIVAMTGDGVNDAPSLKAADIGIAMGMAGTDVAKQASDMILTDDNFATIEKAIEEGRGVYENIRKSVIFLLSSNLGEILTMFVAVICGLASPLKSSHILWINLITDSLPALALGVDRNDGKSLMKNAPRKANESLFSRGGLACTCFYGVLIAGVSLVAFLMLPCSFLRFQGLPITLDNLAVVLRQDVLLAKSQTYAFTLLGMSQLFHAIGMRDVQKSVFRMDHIGNKLMIAAFLIGFALQFAVTEVPFLIQAFGTSHLSWQEWGKLGVLAAFPLFAHECMVLFQRRRL